MFFLSCSPLAPLLLPSPVLSIPPRLTALRPLLVQGFQRPMEAALALLQAAGSAKVQHVCCAGCPDRAGVGLSQAPTRSQKLPSPWVGHPCPSELAFCPPYTAVGIGCILTRQTHIRMYQRTLRCSLCSLHPSAPRWPGGAAITPSPECGHLSLPSLGSLWWSW